MICRLFLVGAIALLSAPSLALSCEVIDGTTAQKADDGEAESDELKPKVYVPLGDPPAAKHPIDGDWPVDAQISPDGKTVGVITAVRSIRIDKALAKVASAIIAGLLWLLWLVVAIRAWRRRGRTPGMPHCRRCGYQLTGINSSKCPECGTALTDKVRYIPRRAAWVFPAMSFLLLGVVTGFLYWQSERVAVVADAILPRWDNVGMVAWVDEDEDRYAFFGEAHFHRVDIYALDNWTLLRSFNLSVDGRVLEPRFGPRLEHIFGAATTKDQETVDILSWNIESGSQTLVTRLPGPLNNTQADEDRTTFVDFESVADDETTLVLRRDHDFCVIEAKADGAEVRSWRSSRDAMLRVPGYLVLEDPRGGSSIVAMKTGQPMGVAPKVDHWFIIGIDLKEQRVIVESVEGGGLVVCDLRDGREHARIPDPSEGQLGWSGFRRTWSTVHRIGPFWAIIEKASPGSMDADGHYAIGLWHIAEQRYVARLDGPWVTPHTDALKVSADGRRGIILDSLNDKVWVYDFGRYVDGLSK